MAQQNTWCGEEVWNPTMGPSSPTIHTIIYDLKKHTLKQLEKSNT